MFNDVFSEKKNDGVVSIAEYCWWREPSIKEGKQHSENILDAQQD